jgi:HK97 gp10 family phage protein
VIKVELQNHLSVLAKVGEIPKSLRAELRKTVQQLTIQLRSRAKAQSPSLTGLLERSIRSKTRFYSVSPEAMVGRVFTRMYYGRFQEYGTKNMVGHSFLRSALQDMSGEITEALQDCLTRIAAKAEKDLSK